MNSNSSAYTPVFEVVSVNNGRHLINDHGRTVALITQHGYVDWLMISPLQESPLLETIEKDTHLSHVLGLKFLLTCPYLNTTTRNGTDLTHFTYRIEEGGKRVILIGEGSKSDGTFTSRTEASLSVTKDGSRYEWSLHTVIENVSGTTQEVAEIEYNNVLPALAYRGILHGRKKEFDCTLMQDKDGTVWEFPHQHSMHYGKKIDQLKFATQSWSGFFGSTNSCPVVIVRKSDIPLGWGICDMYYDLHCMASAPHAFKPQDKIEFQYSIQYLAPAEAATWARNSRKISVDAVDKKRHDYPRFDFGLNSFNRGVHIDLPDEACCYRPHPPEKIWDREVGCRAKGSLRVASQGDSVIWSSEPPFHAVNGTKLRIAGRARVKDVAGKGFCLRLQYYSFCWEPTPGFHPIQTLQSEPLTGTTDWVVVTVPELEIPHSTVEDGMLRLEIVLEGSGTAWVTDIDVEMDEADVANTEHSSLVMSH